MMRTLMTQMCITSGNDDDLETEDSTQESEQEHENASRTIAFGFQLFRRCLRTTLIVISSYFKKTHKISVNCKNHSGNIFADCSFSVCF